MKQYEDLDFSDDFMFSKLLYDDKEKCREILHRILGEEIPTIFYSDYQETINNGYNAKGVRLDILAKDINGNTHDIEMQVEIQKDIPKRCRYYHSMIDMDQLKKGEYYNELKPTYVIFICKNGIKPGMDKAIYKYEYRTLKDNLTLGDGSYTILVNATSTDEDNSTELASLLRYIRNGEIDESDEFIQRLHNSVLEARNRENWRSEYMTHEMREIELKMIGREEGREEGREVGREEGIKECITKLIGKGMVPSEVSKMLDIKLENVLKIISQKC